MATEIVITSQVDFELGTLSGSASASAVPGDVVLINGEGTYATHHLDAGVGQTVLSVAIQGTRPTGTIYCAHFRTAATEGGLATADWSEWYGNIDANGDLFINCVADLLNRALTPQRYAEVETYLVH